ncbi:alpha-E domain-containing protein [Halalkalibacillus halophilus]|uniref:alpha-E domain-containing protein n=1 Tax=Halalkalibacillus halophilus TaxID=392827 RepID=UPI000421D9F0|nr:alpha-E domain-containing protein [Halalkalibacillus halophilus]
MLSRVADSLYWMAKNIERAENNSRIISTRLINVLEADDSEVIANRDWGEIIDICSSFDDYVATDYTQNPDTVIQYLAFQLENPNALLKSIEVARENAKSTREIIPSELFETLNDCYWASKQVDDKQWNYKDVDQLLKQIIQTSFTTQGIIESSLTRDDSYAFIQIGKWLERAEKTSRILTMMCEKMMEDHVQPTEKFYYECLRILQFVNGHEAFLKKYPPSIKSADVLEFLIVDNSFPRSILYCIEHVQDEISTMEDGQVSIYSEALFTILEKATDDLASISTHDATMLELFDFLQKFQGHCNQIGEIFSKTYYLVDPSLSESYQNQS